MMPRFRAGRPSRRRGPRGDLVVEDRAGLFEFGLRESFLPVEFEVEEVGRQAAEGLLFDEQRAEVLGGGDARDAGLLDQRVTGHDVARDLDEEHGVADLRRVVEHGLEPLEATDAELGLGPAVADGLLELDAGDVVDVVGLADLLEGVAETVVEPVRAAQVEVQQREARCRRAARRMAASSMFSRASCSSGRLRVAGDRIDETELDGEGEEVRRG